MPKYRKPQRERSRLQGLLLASACLQASLYGCSGSLSSESMAQGAGGISGNPSAQKAAGAGSGGAVLIPEARGGTAGDTDLAAERGGNAGMANAGTMNGGTHAGGNRNVRDPAAVILVSDDFGAGVPGAQPVGNNWQPYSEYELAMAPLLDDTRSHSAPHSARVTGTNSGFGSFLVPTTGLPTVNNVVFVRAYVNFQKASTEITGHVGLIVGSTPRENDGGELRLGISRGMLDLNLMNSPDGGGEVTRFSSGETTGGDPVKAPGFTFEAERWYCVEAAFLGETDEFRAFIDDVEITELYVTDWKARETSEARTGWSPEYAHVKIGAQNYSADIGHVWYDDVIVATGRIGCN